MSDLRTYLARTPKHYGFTTYWLAHFAAFEDEVHTVYDALVAPAPRGVADVPHKYTLWSYIARCFAFIDFFSPFWSESDNDTRRMAAFLRRNMHRDGLTAHVAVYLWRHPLAHAPFPIMQMTVKVAYTPVPQWRVAPEEHRHHESDDWAELGEQVTRYMHLGLFHLLDGVGGATSRFAR